MPGVENTTAPAAKLELLKSLHRDLETFGGAGGGGGGGGAVKLAHDSDLTKCTNVWSVLTALLLVLPSL